MIEEDQHRRDVKDRHTEKLPCITVYTRPERGFCRKVQLEVAHYSNLLATYLTFELSKILSVAKKMELESAGRQGYTLITLFIAYRSTHSNSKNF